MAKAKLATETTDWLDVEITSPKLQKAHAEYRKAMETMKAAREAMEAIKTAELVKAGLVPAGYVPVYAHRFGWSIATEKADGAIIVQEATKAKATGRRSI